MERLVVHVGDGAGFGEEIGVAGTIARVNGDRTTGSGGDANGEVFPERDGAEAFVEEDELRRARITGVDAMDFQAMAVNRECEG
jgi:hypothetical protein